MQIKAEYACLQAYLTQFIWRSNHMSKANCANKMEEAAKKTAGVKDATVNFMALKMIVEFEDRQEPKEVMQEVLKNCKKVEDDCEIFL